jgi:hypothetical protein
MLATLTHGVYPMAASVAATLLQLPWSGNLPYTAASTAQVGGMKNWSARLQTRFVCPLLLAARGGTAPPLACCTRHSAPATVGGSSETGAPATLHIEAVLLQVLKKKSAPFTSSPASSQCASGTASPPLQILAHCFRISQAGGPALLCLSCRSSKAWAAAAARLPTHSGSLTLTLWDSPLQAHRTAPTVRHAGDIYQHCDASHYARGPHRSTLDARRGQRREEGMPPTASAIPVLFGQLQTARARSRRPGTPVCPALAVPAPPGLAALMPASSHAGRSDKEAASDKEPLVQMNPQPLQQQQQPCSV